MRDQYNALQSSIANVTYSVDSQIGSITNRVETVLKGMNDLTPAALFLRLLGRKIAVHDLLHHFQLFLRQPGISGSGGRDGLPGPASGRFLHAQQPAREVLKNDK